MSEERVRARLAELRREYALGEARLRELRAEESALRDTVLRISGAIQVLEELAGEQGAAASTSAAGSGATPHGSAADGQILTVP